MLRRENFLCCGAKVRITPRSVTRCARSARAFARQPSCSISLGTSFPYEPCPIVVTRDAVHTTMTRGGRSIVVPLDGSKLAEAALPVALDLAGLPKAEVTFLQVILAPEKVIGDSEPITIDQQWQSEKCRARGYLDSIRSRPEWQVCDVEVAVEMGKPAEAILEFADARQGGVHRYVDARALRRAALGVWKRRRQGAAGRSYDSGARSCRAAE